MPKRKYTFSRTDPKLIQECVSLYESGMSTLEIANKIGKSRPMVSLYLTHAGVDTSNMRRYAKHKLNINYFDEINTPNKAYWLGFLLADGSINPSGRSLVLTLARKDFSHLEILKSDMNYSGDIKMFSTRSNEKSYDKSSLDFCSVDLIKNLYAKGWTEFKNSGDLKIFKYVPKNLSKFILRGLFDGDGCITWSGKDAFITFCDTHESVVEWYRDSLVNKLNLPKVKIGKPHKDKDTAYVFHYGGNRQVKKILDYLYSGAGPKLERKYKRYLKVKSINKSYNRKMENK